MMFCHLILPWILFPQIEIQRKMKMQRERQKTVKKWTWLFGNKSKQRALVTAFWLPLLLLWIFCDRRQTFPTIPLVITTTNERSVVPSVQECSKHRSVENYWEKIADDGEEKARRKSSHQFHSHIVFCSTFEIIFLCVLFASIFSHSHNLHKNMICCSSRSLLSFVFGERCECWNVDCLARCSFVSVYVLHSLHILLRGNVKGEMDGFTKSHCQWWRTAQHRMKAIFRCAIFRLFLVHDRIRCHLPARRITTAINKSIKHTLATHSDVFDRLFLPNHVFVCFSFFWWKSHGCGSVIVDNVAKFIDAKRSTRI